MSPVRFGTPPHIRLRELPRLIHDRPQFTAELARHFGVSRRTIQRDIYLLKEEEKEQIQEDSHGRHFIPYGQYRPYVRVTAVGALFLHTAARLLYHHADERNRFVQETLRELASILPQPVQAQVWRAIQAIAERQEHPNPEYMRNIEWLARGWLQGRWLRFQYRSAQGEDWHTNEIAPYFVEVGRHNLVLYVIGLERTYFKDVRPFKVDRMRDVQLLDETYQTPEDFDPMKFFSTAWDVMIGEDTTTVRLRFDPTLERRLKEEAQWHGSEERHWESDGTCHLTLRVANTLELLPWIRSWGPGIEVLEPPELRQQVAEDLRQAMERYGGGDSLRRRLSKRG